MTEQQNHLQQVVQQAQEIQNNIEKQRALLLKLQGVVEYLQGLGVTLPTQEELDAETAQTEVVEDSPEVEESAEG
jgi:cbb3-type cytochrome oxidase cytochrome c subunit